MFDNITRFGFAMLLFFLGSGWISAQDLQKENARLKKEIARLREEQKTLIKSVEQQQATIAKLLNSLKKSEQKRLFFEQALTTSQKRTNDLLKQIRQLSKKISGSPNNVKLGKGPNPNPPAKNVKGKITEVSTKGKIVKLNVGSKHGLKKGHTLDIVRLTKPPKYLGMIIIVEVADTTAVGQRVVTGQFASTVPLKVGDTVIPDVLSSK